MAQLLSWQWSKQWACQFPSFVPLIDSYWQWDCSTAFLHPRLVAICLWSCSTSDSKAIISFGAKLFPLNAVCHGVPRSFPWNSVRALKCGESLTINHQEPRVQLGFPDTKESYSPRDNLSKDKIFHFHLAHETCHDELGVLKWERWFLLDWMKWNPLVETLG